MKIGFGVVLLFFSAVVVGQTNRDLALEKKAKAIELMDKSKPDEAIPLLEEANKLDPGHWEYDYERAFAYYLKKDLKTSIKIFSGIIKKDDATDQCYQMLGNLVDIEGDPSKALKIYEKGLKKFPKSGKLLLETGNIFFNQKSYPEALSFYELGIKDDPAYASNYYRAALIYCGSDRKVWGLLYGEMFMNLERNSKRTEAMSKILYDTYKGGISIQADKAITNFSGVTTLSVEDVQKGRMPYGPMIYEPVLLLAIGDEKSVDLNSLDRIRSRFVENYFSADFSKSKPNILFDYQKLILKYGFLDCYNHWILMAGDKEMFDKWKGENNERWNQFMSWFSENPILVDGNNKLSSDQY